MNNKEQLIKLENRTAELVRANKALKDSEEKYRRLSEAAIEGIVIVDQGIVVEANEAIAGMFGYKLSEVIGIEATCFISPEERGNVQDKMSSEDEGPYESIGLRKDGSLFPIEVHVKIFDYKGEQVRVSAVRDLTEKKRTEKALQESEQNMASVLNNTKDAVVRIDKDFRHIFANPSLYAATGLSPEQYLGKTNEEIGMPEELCTFWHQIHESVFRNGKPEIVEFTFITANKEEKVFQAVVTPEFDEDKEVATIISVMRDITEIKRAESERNAVIDKLEKALAEIKTLRGFIPICANCKNIRDDKGYWQQIEEYIQDRSDAQFSHGLCPECAKKLYPDLDLHNDL